MKNINIIGCGTMGSQLACLFGMMGYNVNIWSRSNINLDKLEKQRKLLSRFLKIYDKNGSFNVVNSIEDLKNFITIECLAEDKELKINYFLSLSKVISKEIFTNTSSIKTSDIDERLSLLHFFNPISMKIIEYNKKNKLSDEATSLIEDLKKENFQMIEVSDFTGYAFNKLLFLEISNLFFLIEKENLNKKYLETILKHLNKDLDILNTIDIIGVDVCLKILENLNKDYNTYIPRLLSFCFTQKILGKKNKTSVKTIFNSEKYPNNLWA